MLSDLDGHRLDVGDLAPLGSGLLRAAEPGAAAAARGRLMPDHHIRTISQLHRRPRLALRPSGPAAGLLAQRLRLRLGQPVGRRRPAGVLRVPFHLGRQISDLLPQVRHQHLQRGHLPGLLPQPRDQLIALSQQLPQPRVRGAKPRDHRIRRRGLSGYSGRTGHNRHTDSAGPQ